MVLRVHLDQNKWIDLARANTGHPLGAPFQDVLRVAEFGVAIGAVSFPLNGVHYVETWKPKGERQRRDVAQVMMKLARPPGALRPHTLAPRVPLIKAEFLAAMSRRFGRPAVPPPIVPFGEGVDFALWMEATPPEMTDPVVIADWEEWILGGPPAPIPPDQHGIMTDQAEIQQFLSGEATRVQLYQQPGMTADDRNKHLAIRLCEEFLKTFVADTLPLLGISTDEFVAAYRHETKDVLDPERFVDDMPVLAASHGLHVIRYQNPQLTRKASDFHDLLALSIALVYCDIVVIEKAFASYARRAKLDQRFSTTILTDLTELPNYVIAGCR